MLSESRRRKLEMLTRSLSSGDIKAAQELLRGIRPTGKPRAGAGTYVGNSPAKPYLTLPPAEPVTLEQAAPGQEFVHGSGKFWLIRRTLAEVSGDSLDVQRQYAAVLRGARQRFDELKVGAALCHIADGAPEGPLFMDIETCGLAGTCIFLVGTMSFQKGELIFEQLLARHYGEEPGILAAFADRLAAASTLITFNGKSFDMTSIRERAIFHGLDLGREPPHCDLLHESRKRWRGILPNCRLQTLEQHLCRRRRVGDIAGAEIPDAYHRFVAGGNAAQLKAILHHNLLDLLTLSQLLCAVLTGEQPDVDG